MNNRKFGAIPRRPIARIEKVSSVKWSSRECRELRIESRQPRAESRELQTRNIPLIGCSATRTFARSFVATVKRAENRNSDYQRAWKELEAFRYRIAEPRRDKTQTYRYVACRNRNRAFPLRCVSVRTRDLFWLSPLETDSNGPEGSTRRSSAPRKSAPRRDRVCSLNGSSD